MGNATGFTYDEHSDGSVTVFHHGRKATVLRGTRAQEFLAELEHGDRQTVMARWTGNYRRGNERLARNHPRNAG
ncbi:MAG: hypothetical protein JF587_21280 [Catenulisporales bacterium]|jgi:hypothetical protein|nr:hypothetical protein [Catenulisporales bacterium]